MPFGSCNPSGRWDEVLVHESKDALMDILESSFHFRDVFLQKRRVLLVVLLSLLSAICSCLAAISAAEWASLLSLHKPQSTLILQRSVTVCCPFCCFCVTPFLTVCTWFPQLGCFLLLNFNLRSNLNLVLSCFLGNLLLPCVDDFQYLCFSSSIQLLRDIVLFVRLGLQLALLCLFF